MTRSPSSTSKNPYAKAGWKYAQDVVAGRIPACLYVIQACQRAIDDYARQKQPGFPYRFDPALAARVCEFIELLRHVKGLRAGEKIRLEPFQIFILTQLCGWVDEDGHRRFRRALILIPRGNGKSTIASGLALYMLAADSNQADVYCAATTRDQAAIVFRDAAEMARKAPEMRAALGIVQREHQILVPNKNSRFIALSSESHGLDGLNISCAILDELAQHPDSRVFDAISTGAGKRPSSLVFCITTAGSNQLGPGYQQAEYLRTVLNRTVKDEQLFGVIWTIDDKDDWTTTEAAQKANPGWGVSVEPSYVEGLREKAHQLPTDQPAYKQKHLNIWTAADQQFIDMAAWARQADPKLALDQFIGQPVWIGLDLASKLDLSARILLFTRMLGEEKHYYLFGRAYLPEATVNTNATYQGWRMEDILSVTAGEVTDFELIMGDLIEDCRQFDVRVIAVDPWQGSFVLQRLQAEGAPVTEYRNNVATMSNPMKELQALIASGRLHHNGDPILAWCMGNLVAHLDQKDNVFPRKNLVSQKIDLAVATIFALGMEMAEQPILDGEIYFVPFR